MALMLAALGATGAPAKLWQSTQAEDYTIDRKEVFEFTQKPVVSRAGDSVTIRFTSKDYCDATVVIEKSDPSAGSAGSPQAGSGQGGTILCHLASGVLGKNAPEPFQPNALEQTVVWDGKNDMGVYVDDLSDVQVRVSLGLKPRFEKTLFWHPKKICSMRRHPRAVAQPEGVYVYDGGGVEQVKLFSHAGRYIRTVYPFPAAKAAQVKGLGWRTFADGHKNPKHIGYWQATFLSSGSGLTTADWGTAATAFAVHNGNIAVVPWSQKKQLIGGLARFRTDGTTGPLALDGPKINTHNPVHSAAFSPDGKWLYMTGPYRNIQQAFAAMPMRPTWTHAVYRMEYAGTEPPQQWLGTGKAGKGENEFHCPSSVCVDAKGRVYIADNHNDRVRIFAPDGKLIKNLSVKAPAVVQIHHKTQELYVFGWTMAMGGGSGGGGVPYRAPADLYIFDPFQSDKPKLQTPIPLWGYSGQSYGLINSSNGYTDEMPYRATLNSYTDPATIWMVTGYLGHRNAQDARAENFQRYQIKDGKFALLETWNDEVIKETIKWHPPGVYVQKLLVDPRNGMLYSTEGYVSGELIRVDPDSGKVSALRLPYEANEIAFDNSGHLYLRCDRLIGRFMVDGLREVPFDYGEERHAKWSSFTRGKSLISAIVLPGNRSVNWQESGMWVNPKGEIAVSAVNSAPRGKRVLGSSGRPQAVEMASMKYVPEVFPGRRRYSEIHLFDKHGKPIGMDIAGQGSPEGTATLIDTRGDIYFHANKHRVYNGKPFEPLTGSLIKFKRGKGRFISTRGEIALSKERTPDGPQQISGYWIEDAEWIYPAAGFSRQNAPCTCWLSNVSIDLLNRCFIPQYVRGQVAVLDTNGNLILQIGRYGNVDDGNPLVEDQRFRTEPPRAIGPSAGSGQAGDEVALMYPNYVAAHSDRRLFISDTGNGRILSVKLDYHADERVALKELPNQQKQ
jgi:hypothetical protein